VLPFTNMSGDPEQRYFSDGVTEDIITELSRFRDLFVIARNSSFQYRDKATDVRRVARELGVRYVVEGSLRRAGDYLRITVQLIEATTGNHVWSERYDRRLADVFTIQDEVVRAIVARIAGQLTIFEFEKARRKRTEHLGAYDCFLRGLDHWRDAGADEGAKSSRWFEKALELDPDYAEPLPRLSINAAVEAFNSDSADRFDRALALANKAVALDPNSGWAHCALGFAKLASGSLPASACHFETALRLNPNDADLMMWCVNYYIYSGEFDVAHKMIKACEQLNPLPPPWYRTVKAITEYGLRRYAASAQLLESLGSTKFYWLHCYLAASYWRLGKTVEAEREVAMALKVRPAITVKELAVCECYMRAEDLEHLLEPMREAGLPE
jgi:TolB-like protein